MAGAIGQFFSDLAWAAARVARTSLVEAQAAAFNLFFAFLPMQLLALGVLSTTEWFAAAVEQQLARLEVVLPPGSRQVVLDLLLGRTESAGMLIAIGLAGTALLGAQLMIALMRGFARIHGEPAPPCLLALHARALAMLGVALGPWVASLLLTVLGEWLRERLIAWLGLPWLFRGAAWLIYVALTLVAAAAVLALVYRLGRPAARGWREVWPGAAVATLVWWSVNAAFAYYVRRVPYGILYGGLAAAIGLTVWMYLTMVVVLFGAAFNAARLRRPAVAAAPPPRIS